MYARYRARPFGPSPVVCEPNLTRLCVSALVLNLVLDNNWFGLGSSGNASSSIIRPILE
jgi:hypothetical protein